MAAAATPHDPEKHEWMDYLVASLSCVEGKTGPRYKTQDSALFAALQQEINELRRSRKLKELSV